jgi:hypothetical protein
MNKINTRSIVNEIYSHVIDVTIESLRKYFGKKKKISSRFDILGELKSRWKARLNCLFYSLEGSWIRFQEIGSKINEFPKKSESNDMSISIYNFPLVCNLSWDLLTNLYPPLHKISGFKSWIWNCLVSQIINEGVFPCQSFKLKLKKRNNNIIFSNQLENKIHTSYQKNFYDKYSDFLVRGFNFYENVEMNLQVQKKMNKKNKEILLTDEIDSLESNIDEDSYSNENEETEEKIPKNFILAITEKVYRRNTKWRIILKDGILHMNEKDFLFNSCKCEFFW